MRQSSSHNVEPHHQDAGCKGEAPHIIIPAPWDRDIKLPENVASVIHDLTREYSKKDRMLMVLAHLLAPPLELLRRVTVLSEDGPVNALWNMGLFAVCFGVTFASKPGADSTWLPLWGLAGLTVAGGFGLLVSNAPPIWEPETKHERRDREQKSKIKQAISEVVRIRLDSGSTDSAARVRSVLGKFEKNDQIVIVYVADAKLKRLAGRKLEW